MQSFLVLTFLCLSACVASVHGSSNCFLRCLMLANSNDCNCNNLFDYLNDQGRRQEHHHHHHHTPHPQETPEPESTISPIRLLKTTTIVPKLVTTTDICDYLCKIQLGGDACQCSKPGLPGR